MTPAPGVLVAGGTGALGVAVVRTLAAAGRPLSATWRTAAARERAEREIGAAGAVEWVEADLTDPDAAQRAVAAARDIGAVVTTVGGYAGGRRLHEDDPETLARMLALNLLTAHNLARAAVPALLAGGGGSFVAVAARAALRPARGAGAYAASKAALVALVQALDADYRADGVRANVVLPNVIDTPANRAAMPDSTRAGWSAPEAVARVIGFLVSEDSAATSGAAVPV